MPKGKYILSAAGAEELMSRMERIAQENMEEDPTGLSTGVITTDFVQRLTKVNSVEQVIDNNEQLSKTYDGLLGLYGFESMYDMYMYAASCDHMEQLVKGKDYSKLVPVKRKIMRNGKETEVTIYEDPNKGDKDDNSSGGSKGSGKGKGKGGGGKKQHARDLTASIIADKEAANPKTVAKVKEQAKGLSGGDKAFQDTSQFYLVVKGEGGAVAGIVGYSEEGEFIVMDFYRTNGEVSGVATRGFFEMINQARKRGKGVKMKDQEQARPIFAKSGLHQEGDYWIVTSDELKELFGESGAERG